MFFALALSMSLAATAHAADLIAPVVSIVTPFSATAGQATTLSMTASDENAGIRNCYLIIGVTALSSNMTRVSGDAMSATYSQAYTFPFAGSYTVAARCVDQSDNVGTGSNVTVTVSEAAPAADTTPPVLGGITPTTATAGVATTFSVNYADDGGVDECRFNPGNGMIVTALQSGSHWAGTASYTYTFASPGTYSIGFVCGDFAGNSSPVYRTVNVSGGGPDVTAPVVGPVTGSATIGVGVPTIFASDYTDNVGVNSCFLTVNGSSMGLATLSSSPTAGVASRSHTFSAAGSYVLRISCRDAALNNGDSVNRAVTVTATAPTGDVLAPTFTGALMPLTATVNAPAALSIGYSDNVGVTECYLYVDGSLAGGSTSGGMTGTTSRFHTFTTTGAHTVRFQCRDAASNQGVSTTYTVNVAAVSAPGGGSGGSGGTPTPTPIPTPGSVSMGNLIKAICPTTGIVNADHPCRAVYYYGQDGRRHAFPNERVFFTWFSDFNGVREVSGTTMASIGLGRNVTYRPGTRMIKFRTVNRVYAIARGGTLRWVTTEEVARQLYGATWATKIDDVGDTFYSNYTTGADITASTQFNSSYEAGLAATIDQNW